MLNPATILLIVQAIQAAIKAAPMVEEIVVKAKDWVTSLFSAGLISIETQHAIHSHIDALTASVNSGQVPPEFQVEADPS